MPTSGHKNQVWVVFGGTGEVGQVLLTEFLSQWEEAKFVLVDKQEQEGVCSKLKEAVKGIVGCHAADATSHEEVNKAFDAICAEHGAQLAGVVNLVGNVERKALADTTPEDFLRILQLNLMSAFNILQRGVKELEKSQVEDKSILMVTGVAAQKGVKHYEAWAAAKAGVEGLVRTSAASCAPKGIRVNAVAPGLTETAAERAGMPAPAQEKSARLYPLKCLASTSEVASAIEFMMCPHRSSYISGQVLAVDAGFTTTATATEE